MSPQITHWLQLGRMTADRLRWSFANWRDSKSARRPASLLLIGLERRLLMSATPLDPAMLAGNAMGESVSSEVSIAMQSDLGSTSDSTGHVAPLEFSDPAAPALNSMFSDTADDGIITVTTLSDLNDTGSEDFDSATLFSDRGSDGEISLAEAILAANNTPGADEIRFDIVGSGPRVIELHSPLPQVMDSIVIDGTTQSGYADRPVIFLDGKDFSMDGLVLDSGSDGSEVRGLGLMNFDGNAIVVRSSANAIAGNWIGGFDPASGDYDASLSNGQSGIIVSGADNIIGGSHDFDRNVIGGNTSFGVILAGPSATDNTVVNNWIGVTADGIDDAPMGLDGIGIFDSAGHNSISRNVVGNARHGIHLYDASENVLIVNAIGTSHSQTRTFGNAAWGIQIAGNSEDNQIGRSGQGNVIVGNASGGVTVLDSSTRNSIRFNQITDNRQLPIDLGGDGIDTNDRLDLDLGGNQRQNRPTLNSVTLSPAGLLTVDLDLHSESSQIYRIDLYEASVNAGSVGDPVRHLGSSIVTTSAAGMVNHRFVGTAPWTTGSGLVVATATDDEGNTSEFSSLTNVSHGTAAPIIEHVETDPLFYVENSGAQFVTSSIEVLFGSSSLLRSATVTVLDYEVDQDVLGLIDQPNVTGFWNPVAGVLTLSGWASASEYQDALRSVTFQIASENPSVASRTISMKVYDGARSSNVATRVINPIQHDDPATGNLVIRGTGIEDQTLSVDTTGIEDPDGLSDPHYVYQWFRGGSMIVGATSSSYLLQDADVGATLSVEVAFRDDLGNTTTMVSSSVGPISNVNDVPSGVPVIQGTFVDQQTITALVDEISDADGMPRAADFQWLRDDAEINGAQGQTYSLTNGDVGHLISVRMTYVDLQGTKESLVSKPTTPIAKLDEALVLEDLIHHLAFGEALDVGKGVFTAAAGGNEGDSFTALLVNAPTNGTLQLQGDGSFRYTPPAQFYGIVTFSWQAFDGKLRSNVATVSIVIAPPVSAPGDSDSAIDKTGGEIAGRDSSDKTQPSDPTEGSRPGSGTVFTGISTGAPLVRGGSAPLDSAVAMQSSDELINDQNFTRLMAFDGTPEQDGTRSIELATANARSRHIERIVEVDRKRLVDAAQQRDIETVSPQDWADYDLLGDPGQMWQEFDNNRHHLNTLLGGNALIVGSFGIATGGFGVMALAWLRSGFLVMGFWQQRPLWSRMDPLVLMQGLDPDDDESLADVIADQRRKVEQDINHDEME